MVQVVVLLMECRFVLCAEGDRGFPKLEHISLSEMVLGTLILLLLNNWSALITLHDLRVIQ